MHTRPMQQGATEQEVAPPLTQAQNAVPRDGWGTTLVDRASDGLGLGQNAVLLRDPKVGQVAPTRDDLAIRKLTDASLPMFTRVPNATTTDLVYQDALRLRTDTDTVLRPYSMRPVGPDQHLIGTFEDFQLHPTIASTSVDARNGRPLADNDAQRLASAWRYPYDEIGTVAAAGLVTSMLNFQENRAAQVELERHAKAQGASAMPGATQMYDYEGKGIFGEAAGRIVGSAPALETQGILSVVPASGAVVRANDAVPENSLAALTNIEDRTIQGERVLAYDNQLRQVRNYTEADQFRTGQP